jgi:hypothetical protein
MGRQSPPPHNQDLSLELVRGFKAREVAAEWRQQLMAVGEGLAEEEGGGPGGGTQAHWVNDSPGAPRATRGHGPQQPAAVAALLYGRDQPLRWRCDLF